MKTNWNKQQVLSKKDLVKLLAIARQKQKGAVEKTVAKAKEVVEDAKGAVEGAVEGLKNAFK